MIINFKFYTQYHIQSVKSFLHIRMNKKFKELDMKFNNCKIISDDVLKEVEVSNFFDRKQEKEDDIKLFTEEVGKIKT